MINIGKVRFRNTSYGGALGSSKKVHMYIIFIDDDKNVLIANFQHGGTEPISNLFQKHIDIVGYEHTGGVSKEEFTALLVMEAL